MVSAHGYGMSRAVLCLVLRAGGWDDEWYRLPMADRGFYYVIEGLSVKAYGKCAGAAGK
jgi:hypothetical protein